MPHRHAPAVAVAPLVALMLVAGACTQAGDDGTTGDGTAPRTGERGDDDVGPPREGGTLTMAVPAATDGWNPAVNHWADAGNLIGSTFIEPLVVFDGDGQWEPWLAESLEPVDDELRVWRIGIRRGITFHDGTPLDAEAVRTVLEFHFDHDRSLTAIAVPGLVRSVDVHDTYEVDVTFAEPNAAAPAVFGNISGYIMAPSMLEDPDLATDAPVGTGPFELVEWQPGHRVTVRRNEHYWREGLPHLDEIEFLVVRESADRANALRGHSIDALLTTTASTIDRLADDHTVVRDDLSEQTLVMLNTAREPFDDIHARRAVAHATDREALRGRLGGNVALSDSPLLAGTVWELDDEDAGYVDFDPAAARAEIEAYRRSTGERELAVTLSGLAAGSELEVMQMLHSQWEDVGIDVTIETLDQAAYIGQTISGSFEAAYFRNYAYPDPDALRVFWHSDSARGPGQFSTNFSQWSDPAVDEALRRGRATTDPLERRVHYHEAVRLRNEAVLDIWLFNTPAAIVADRRVRGLDEFERRSFATNLPKPWVGELWIEP